MPLARRTYAVAGVMLACVFYPVWSCHAQSQRTLPDSGSSAGETFLRDSREVLNAAGYVFSSPARWGVCDWISAGGIVAGTGAAYSLDTKTLSLMDRNRSEANDRIEKVVVVYGSGGYVLGAAACAYATGLFLDNEWIRTTALLTGSAVVFSGTISSFLKATVGRGRPYAGLGNHFFRPFSLEDGFLSFPSGHTIVAFSVSTVLAERIHSLWASIGLYGLAITCAVSRLYTHEHWLSDIVFGAAYSTALSHALVSWYQGRHGPDGMQGFRIGPSEAGVTLSWSW